MPKQQDETELSSIVTDDQSESVKEEFLKPPIYFLVLRHSVFLTSTQTVASTLKWLSFFQDMDSLA